MWYSWINKVLYRSEDLRNKLSGAGKKKQPKEEAAFKKKAKQADSDEEDESEDEDFNEVTKELNDFIAKPIIKILV